MGIDDRDYMRERYRARAGRTKWNDRAGRVEGAWFDPVNRGFDYQRGRVRSPRRDHGSLPRWLPLALAIMLVAIAAWPWLRQMEWPPGSRAAISFPASGSVTVNRALEPGAAISRMKVTADRYNALVQLFQPDTDAHVLSVYVREGNSVTVPVPPGVFRMRLIEGDTWYGPVRFFGPSTRFETVRELQTFTVERGGGIDLRRTPMGTMKTKAEWRSPPPL